MSIRTLTPCLLALSLLASGCVENADLQAPTAAVEIRSPDPLPIQHPAVDIPPTSRGVKRLTVTMLRGTLPVVAGNDATGTPINWTIKAKGTVYEALREKVLGGALGHPDYISVTVEPSEPTALYLKFVDDMARDVCTKMLSADKAQPAQDKRNLVRFTSLDDASDTEATRKNLRYLMLRFLGQRVADDDTETTQALETLFDTASTAADAAEGWRAVCVGLMSSPAFHIY